MARVPHVIVVYLLSNYSYSSRKTALFKLNNTVSVELQYIKEHFMSCGRYLSKNIKTQLWSKSFDLFL